MTTDAELRALAEKALGSIAPNSGCEPYEIEAEYAAFDDAAGPAVVLSLLDRVEAAERERNEARETISRQNRDRGELERKLAGMFKMNTQMARGGKFAGTKNAAAALAMELKDAATERDALRAAGNALAEQLTVATSVWRSDAQRAALAAWERAGRDAPEGR